MVVCHMSEGLEWNFRVIEIWEVKYFGGRQDNLPLEWFLNFPIVQVSNNRKLVGCTPPIQESKAENHIN
jgi:hypothetical protein